MINSISIPKINESFPYAYSFKPYDLANLEHVFLIDNRKHQKILVQNIYIRKRREADHWILKIEKSCQNRPVLISSVENFCSVMISSIITKVNNPYRNNIIEINMPLQPMESLVITMKYDNPLYLAADFEAMINARIYDKAIN